MTVEYHPAWQGELEQGARYYNDQSGPRLRNDFLREARATIERIKATPLGFTKAYGPVRRARLKRFKAYAIRYWFVEDTDTLRILSIVHGARHPDYGKDRR